MDREPTPEERARERGEQLRKDMEEWKRRMLFERGVEEAHEQEHERER